MVEIEMYRKTDEMNDYKYNKKIMEKERLERLKKKKKRQKDIEKMHLLKSQARKEYNSNFLATGSIGPVSRKAIEAYEIQQMLMNDM